MTKNTWLGLSLAAAIGLAGAAIAQDRDLGTQRDRDQQRLGQGQTGQNIGIGGKLDENQVKQVFNQKEYLKSLNITPRVEGDTIILQGTVPTKAHVVAAVLAAYEIPNVKHVNCQLNFSEATGQLGMGQQPQGGLFGEKQEGRTLGAGSTQAQQIEVVAAIFPLSKAMHAGTVQAGVREAMTDVIIFRPQSAQLEQPQGIQPGQNR
jgi:hypothetical protein